MEKKHVNYVENVKNNNIRNKCFHEAIPSLFVHLEVHKPVFLEQA